MPRGIKRDLRLPMMKVRFTFKDAPPKIVSDVEQVIGGGRFIRLVTHPLLSGYTGLVEVSLEELTGYTIIMED